MKEKYVLRLPIKFTRNAERKKTLVAETLVLAKTHGYVEKIEHELEEELQRDEREPDSRYLAKHTSRLSVIFQALLNCLPLTVKQNSSGVF
ncbi:hypothetical protein ElyMa_001454900 [Elysia marginata]|uniref:Uncharacterized protein n=1 Tax=Elysia marginata TaxID=1093978 RepID=A0AAV4J086_9GAST|nr:hypothetical protein ElyMa_001454900 [Elysia marginata]